MEVISGPVFKNIIEAIGQNQMSVPGYFYKVIIYLDENELWQGVGLLLTHLADRRTPVEGFIVPIRDIEHKTGLDFNCSMPDSIQHRIETTIWSD